MSVAALVLKNQSGLLPSEYYCRSARLNLLQKFSTNKAIRVPNTQYDGITVFHDRLYWWMISGSEMLLCFTKRSQISSRDDMSPRCRISCGGTAAPLCVDAKDHILTASGGGRTLHVIDPLSLNEIDTIRHPKAVTHHALASLDPYVIACGCTDSHIYLSDFRTGTQILTMTRSEEPWLRRCTGTPKVKRHCVAWSSSESRLLFSLMNGPCPLQALDIRMPKAALNHFAATDYDCVDYPVPAISCVREYVAVCCNDYNVRVFDVLTGSLIQTLFRYNVHVKGEQLSPVLFENTSPPVLMVANSEMLAASTVDTNESLVLMPGNFGKRNHLHFDPQSSDLYWIDKHKELNILSLAHGYAPSV